MYQRLYDREDRAGWVRIADRSVKARFLLMRDWYADEDGPWRSAALHLPFRIWFNIEQDARRGKARIQVRGFVVKFSWSRA